MNENNKIVIYTDGSSLGNPGPGGFGAVIWIEKENKIIEIGEASEGSTTNNRMEITAAIESILAVKNYEGQIIIYTDSEYLLNGITKWIFGWIKKGWRTADKKPVLNQDLWERLHLAVQERENGKSKIKWIRVPGHMGHLGNERADTIATACAEGNDVVFAHGTKEEYEKLFGGKLVV